MLNIQFLDLSQLLIVDMSSLELSCMFDILDSLNDMYGYNEMLE